jgi:hypothetical protein
MWQQHANLNFENDIQNPDIIISNTRGIPKYQKIGSCCPKRLEGCGSV